MEGGLGLYGARPWMRRFMLIEYEVMKALSQKTCR